ncbi:MAG: O-antigen ligase family protein [Candidatus Taylorbacteria bacterium]|nr:O-antigen ligase family protein [Candidatus Taylorbacteria bacterium]
MIKQTAKFISVAALFLIPFFALIVADTYFFPFITGKAFYFRILVEIAFAGWLILAFMDAKYRPKLTPLTIGVTVFALVTLVADLLGVNPLRSMWSNFERMEGWITVIHLWMFFITATSIFGSGEEGKRLWHRWINMQLTVAVIVGIYGIMQLLGKAEIHQGSTRIDASLGNAAYMAVYMLWNTGLAAYMFFIARAKQIGNAKFLQWAYPILAVVFGFEVFETATRGTILGLIGGILLALFLYAVLGKNETKKNRWIAVGIIVFIFVLGGIFWANRDTAFVRNSEALSRMASISWSEAQGQARNYIWPMAIKGFTERPVFGWGQENFNYIFNANYNPKMWGQEQWFDRAHSVFLDWLTASGILGLVSYLALYVLALMIVWRSSLTITEKSVLTGAIVGYAIHNIFVFDNIASYVLFFAALGFINSIRSGKSIFTNRVISAEAASYIAVPVAFVALLAVVYVFNVRPIQANTRLIAALQVCSGPNPSVALFDNAFKVNTYVANQEIREQLFSCANRVLSSDQVPGVTKQSFFDLARKAIDDQIAATPWQDARVYTLAGSFMNMIGQFNYALPLLEKAHALSPGKQSVDVELATDLMNSKQSARAVALLMADYEIIKDNPLVNRVYALALVVDGQEALARKLFGDNPEIFDNIQMAQAYTMSKQLLKAIEVYKKILKETPNDLSASISLARLQYTIGQKTEAIKTFRAIEIAYPQYKTEIEAAIKQAQQ